ncbi:MAG: hypothetical protein NUV56_04630 [Candidatus Uhrbacteria bacterium]|nr:hypothetical protein [Candidatus Uhrbacteria bacterium]
MDAFCYVALRQLEAATFALNVPRTWYVRQLVIALTALFVPVISLIASFTLFEGEVRKCDAISMGALAILQLVASLLFATDSPFAWHTFSNWHASQDRRILAPYLSVYEIIKHGLRDKQPVELLEIVNDKRKESLRALRRSYDEQKELRSNFNRCIAIHAIGEFPTDELNQLSAGIDVLQLRITAQEAVLHQSLKAVGIGKLVRFISAEDEAQRTEVQCQVTELEVTELEQRTEALRQAATRTTT